MKRFWIGLVFAGVCVAGVTNASLRKQEKPLRLWEGVAPYSLNDGKDENPTVRFYPATKNPNGAAMVICPGGGYGTVVPHEGEPVAKRLNELGISAVVLQYRVGPRYRHPAPLADALRAMRFTRYHAKEWGIDPERIGVMGFSAGGHLASSVATQGDAGDPAAVDPIDKLSSKPTLAVLIYPVITMSKEYTHGGSRENLLGPNPEQKLVDKMSSEKQVTKETAPTFLVHGLNDSVVPCENAFAYAEACRKAGASIELHLLENFPHGATLGDPNAPGGTWVPRCEEWMRSCGFLMPKPRNEK